MEVLYNKSFSQPLLRCLTLPEAEQALHEIHGGVCGNHLGGRSLANKVLRARYYWPTILKDSKTVVKNCDKDQQHTNIQHQPAQNMTPVSAPRPFDQWGIDIVGPFPLGKGQVKFLVVAIDYFTKCVEAQPLVSITEEQIWRFVWTSVVCRFEIPRVIISNNGRQFDNRHFKQFCEELGIRQPFSSPVYPQANGQVEVTNRTIITMLKTKLDNKKGAWAEEVPKVLWAYRTTARTPTEETPFSLTYGVEAMIPVEKGIHTYRVSSYDPEKNDHERRTNLDLLEET